MSETSANSKRCSRCGTTFPDASGSLCPRCLMAQIVQPTQPDEAGAPLPPFSPEELAPHFPQLEILECLGRGGMGVVYKARQKSLNRFVALKLLAPERAGDTEFASRFEKEAQALAALNHPHIVAVYDFGQAGGFYFLLMEFVDGVNLRQLLQAKRLTPKEALSIVPPVCDALQCAHERGIVHRDIKPENLLLDRSGTVKIADFGIAKMLGAASDGGSSGARSEVTGSAGTPAYAAPEQRRGHGAADHRADIYSLGVVLYEMLTGERPKEKIEAPSRRVQVDVRIDEIVLRALETSPEMRFATVADFRTQVDAVVSSTAPASRWSPMKWAAVVLALLAVGGVAYTVNQDAGEKTSATPTMAALSPTHFPQRAPTLADAVAELETAYSELLDEERAAALESLDHAISREMPARPAQRLHEMRARVEELERRIVTLSDPPTSQTENTSH